VGDTEWHLDAACRTADMERFYSGDDADARYALGFCARCEVRVQCLEAAMTAREAFGVWGGTTERERRRIFRAERRRRRQDTHAA
jgi:WhiB family redox-sensing transcriptional regulator